jgi:GNAT superfamily N-acetyltransferase
VEAARRAGDHDLERVGELAQQARHDLLDQRGGWWWVHRDARPEPVEAWLAAVASDADHLVVAGTFDDVVLGYAVAAVEHQRDGSRLGLVEELYVEPAARGVGIGEAMMDEVLAWCEAHQCVGVDSRALPGDRDTKNFFERFGLVARAIVVHRTLKSS